MPRRIEIELTSSADEGRWTWRAAGARQPKGVLDGGILPAGAKVGDVLKVEADIELDGITILSVLPVQQRDRAEPQRIEIVGSGRGDDSPVTTSLSPRREREMRDGQRRGGRPPRDGDRERPPRRDRPQGDRPHGDRPQGDRPPRRDRPQGDRPSGERRPQGDRRPRRPAPPPMPERPKPRRLRAGRAHRKAVLAEVAPEQQPIAEQVLRGGIPAVRQAIDTENEKRKAAGEAPIDGKALLDIAEKLLPSLRTADWRDRADAALADAEQLDLRDLRSVVVASDAAARDDETRALAAKLRETLEARVEAEQATWREDLELALSTGRIVRALRLSSRPPKAGTILSPEVRQALATATAAALEPDGGADRWGAVLDAAAHSPVHNEVVPAGVPESPSDELVATVKRFASRVPKVAAAFGIEAPAPGTRPPRNRRPSKPGARKPPPPPPPAPAAAPRADTETVPAAPEVADAESVVAATEPVAEPEPEPVVEVTAPEPVADTEPVPAAPDVADAEPEPEPVADTEAAASEPEA